MKFLILTSEYPPMRTGVATYSQVIADGLVGRGHKVTVLTFGSRTKSGQTSAREVRLPLGKGKWLDPIRITLGLIAYRFLARSSDATLLSSDLAQRIVGDLHLGGATPFVCVVHGSEVTKRFPPNSVAVRFSWRLRLSTLKRAARVIAISGYTRDLLTSAGLEQTHAHVVYTGIPDEWYDSEPDAAAVLKLKQIYGIDPEEIVALTLARVVERKGHDRVLQALARLLKEYPRVHYVIAGTGEGLQSIRILAQELGLGECVIFAGEVPEDDKKTYYDMCDIFVMPSLHDGRRVEGLGISFIEAGARHKPSIGGSHGGIPEVIDNARTGFLVDPNDIEQLADRLSRLVADAELRRKLGAAAYAHTSQRFRDTRMIDEIEQLLRAAVQVGDAVHDDESIVA